LIGQQLGKEIKKLFTLLHDVIRVVLYSIFYVSEHFVDGFGAHSPVILCIHHSINLICSDKFAGFVAFGLTRMIGMHIARKPNVRHGRKHLLLRRLRALSLVICCPLQSTIVVVWRVAILLGNSEVSKVAGYIVILFHLDLVRAYYFEFGLIYWLWRIAGIVTAEQLFVTRIVVQNGISCSVYLGQILVLI